MIEIFEQALSHQVTWERDPNMRRYFLARRESLLDKAEKKRTLSEFLQDFGFKSLQQARRASKKVLSPVACAALAGDTQVLRHLLEARCPVDCSIAPLLKVGLVELLTPVPLSELGNILLF